jgi:hypothetical protein
VINGLFAADDIEMTATTLSNYFFVTQQTIG